MKRKFLSTIVCLTIILIAVLLLPNKASAAATVASGTCGDNVSWVLDDENVLTISGTGAMADYASASNSPWYSYRDSIKIINISDGVTTIGDRAFYNFTKLCSVRIGEDLATIGTYAFRGCSVLSEITLPASVTELKGSAFRGCSQLATITIEGNAPIVGSYVFNECAASITVKYYEGSTGYDVSLWSDFTHQTMHAGNWEVDVEATCTTEGLSHLICIVCGEKVTAVIPSHIYLNGKCTLCGTDQIIANGTCGTSLNWKLDIWGTLTIFGNGAMDYYTNGSAPWFPHIGLIRNIVVEDTITQMSSGVFYGCSNLQSITLPFVGYSNQDFRYTLGYIFGKSSFNGSTATTQEFAKFSSYTYYIPTSLKTVTVTGGTIPYGAFYNCDNLTNIIMQDGVNGIEDLAFYSCDNIPAILIPNGVTSIGREAFGYCTNLTSITIPDGVIRIGREAFEYCSSLTSVTIPSSLNTIDLYAFYNCKSLTAVCIQDLDAWCNIQFLSPDGQPQYSDSVIYHSSSNPLCYAENLYLNGELVVDVVIPDGIASISDNAFYNCKNLQNITLPQSVKSVGRRAFAGCDSLTNVYISDIDAWCQIVFSESSSNPMCNAKHLYIGTELVTEVELSSSIAGIGNYAFYNCTSLTGITIPESATNIGNRAFYNCTNLIAITVPESVSSIGDYAFYNCRNLTSITIPDGVTSIGNRAFYNCTNLTAITIPDGVTSIGDYMFYYCDSLTSITIPDGVISIGDYMFYYCDSLTDITIPESVTSIGSSAFSGCSSLTSITIPESVTSIGSSAFSGCSSLTSITIPDGVISIGDYMFYYCDSLTDITIPESVTSIGDWAFYGCSSLTSITIPDSVTSIGSYAFSGCSSLTSITIPDSVTSIGGSAFRNCSSLTSITIPDSVTSIGSYAFSDCSSLTSITIPESVTSIGSSAFSSCSSLTVVNFNATNCFTMGSYDEPVFSGFNNYHTTINIGNNVSKIPAYAFLNCSNLTSITIPESVTIIGHYAFHNCSNLNHVAYTGTQSQWDSISISYNNTNLTSATRHYETQFKNVDNCVEIGIYCPVCEYFISRTAKGDGAHSYTDHLDASCNKCDFVRTVTAISISQLPQQLGYTLFESLDITGGQLTLTYDDGSTGNIPMTADMVTGFDASLIGVQQLTVAYGGATASFTVEVVAQKPDSLELLTKPDQLSYIIGDTIDLNGLTLKAYYGQEEAIVTAADATVQADTTSSGVKTATVTFQGLSVTFEIFVHEREPGENWKTVDSSLYPQSNHDYANNLSETKVFTYPDALLLKITFNSSTSVESNYDYIYIYDGAGNQIAEYTGTEAANKTLTISGNTFSVKLTSDSSQTLYGYAFSSIQASMGDIYHPETVLNGYPATFARPGLTDGAVCSICGETIRQQQEIPQLVGKVSQWNMTVADDLKVNFHLEISEEIISTTTVKLKFGGQITGYRADSLPQTYDGKYLITANVSASQMNDDIVILISSGNYLTTSITYSVKQYCDSILMNEQYSSYHALVKEMLNYGAMAQIYFGYETDDLANNNITGAAMNAIPEQAENDMAVTGTIEGISFYGASLVFKDRIAIRYYIRYDGDLAQYSFSAGNLPIAYDIKDGMLCIEIADILPQDLDQQITLTVSDTTGNILAVAYSPMNYIVRMNAKGNENLQNLLKALYNYHLAAKQLNSSAA